MMAVFIAVLALFLGGPLIGIQIVRENARHEGRPLDSRRIVKGAAVAGLICIVPLAYLWTLGAYGDLIVLLIACVPGAIYGALVGLTAVWIRRARADV